VEIDQDGKHHKYNE
jgi:hypothetical protein